VAALTVALYHVSWQTHFSSLGFIRNGSMMVDFFFVLSGFVVFHAYGDRLGSLALTKQFFITRLGRLYPLHLLTLLAFLAIECAKWGAAHWSGVRIASVAFEQNTAASFVANLLLVHSLGPFAVPTWNVPSWSISVEFYTYLLFALVALVRPSRRSWLLLSAGIALGSLAASWQVAGSMESTAQFGWFRCITGFFSGVLVWHFYAALLLRWRSPGVLALVSGVLVAMFLSVRQAGHADFLIVPLFMALILFIALGKPGSMLEGRGFVWLGRISYTTYMIHAVLIWGFEFLLQYVIKVPRTDFYQTGVWMGDMLAAAFVVLLLGASHFTFQTIEDPCRRYAKRFVA